MKKYIIISVGSIAASIFLIVVLYKNVDIPVLDAIVENTTEALGIKPTMVAEKQERKAQQAENLQPTDNRITEQLQRAAAEKRRDDSLAAVQFKLDSIAQASLAAKQPEQPKKKLFNAEVDKELARQLEEEKLRAQAQRIADSLAKVAAVPEKPKRKLFNAHIEEQPISTTTSSGPQLSYLEAKAHGAQRFTDNEVVNFRISKPTTINGVELPANLVFTTKANVFDGKVHFVIQRIENLSGYKGENYHNGTQGLMLTASMKNGDGYVISDGQPFTFGLQKATN